MQRPRDDSFSSIGIQFSGWPFLLALPILVIGSLLIATLAPPQFKYFSGITSLAGLLLVFAARSDLATRQSFQLNRAVQIATDAAEKNPDRSRPAWDLARVTLDAYFSRNLNQINQIFNISVIVMFCGFALIVWGAIRSATDASLLPTVVTASAGAVTEFIGATFLFLYRSTVQQAMKYTTTLERINSVGMAMSILDTMRDVEDRVLTSQTKAALVTLLVKQVSSRPDSC